MNHRLKALADAGVSVWLDDLSRELLESGDLVNLVEEHSVVGVTTNPTIFANAIANGERYNEQLRKLVSAGEPVDKVVFALTTADVRDACDLLAPLATGNSADGRVSIEVEPTLANDTSGTINSAQALWAAIDRPNVLIKIPATKEGLPAITAAIAQGISVNVTLIFGEQRYREVMDAYLTGLEQAGSSGLDLSQIQSVASFFVSRIDTEIDARLEAVGTSAALELKGHAALANARLGYAAYEEVIASERWTRLAQAGAHKQRPLWASTGVKSKEYADTMYVTELIVADTVNTMPRATLEAFADHGAVGGDRVTGQGEKARSILDRITAVGIDFEDVLTAVEHEGVDKFKKSWTELTQTVTQQMSEVPPGLESPADHVGE